MAKIFDADIAVYYWYSNCIYLIFIIRKFIVFANLLLVFIVIWFEPLILFDLLELIWIYKFANADLLIVLAD